MSSTDTVTEAEVVDSTATEVVPYEAPAPTTLFKTDDPVEVITAATKVADALKGILTRQGLTAKISGKDHVLVEGWTTLGSMLGVVPVCTWSRPVDKGWEARVEARTLDGRVIGAAEAQCTHDEKMWKTRDEYALRSMAQTRATSKALRGPLGFIITLAGYSATAPEEMPPDMVDAKPEPPSDPLPDETVEKLSIQIAALLKAKALTPEKLTAQMVAHGVTDTSEGGKAALRTLTPEQAEKFAQTLTGLAEAKAGEGSK